MPSDLTGGETGVFPCATVDFSGKQLEDVKVILPPKGGVNADVLAPVKENDYASAIRCYALALEQKILF